MRTIPHISYKKHVFVGVNEDDSSADLFLMIKSFLQANDLTRDILVTKTGCMGQCGSEGATIVIYPDMKWFINVTHEDLEEIHEYIMK